MPIFLVWALWVMQALATLPGIMKLWEWLVNRTKGLDAPKKLRYQGRLRQAYRRYEKHKDSARLRVELMIIGHDLCNEDGVCKVPYYEE